MLVRPRIGLAEIGLALLLCCSCGSANSTEPPESPVGTARATVSSGVEANIELAAFTATRLSFGPSEDCSASTILSERCAKVLSVRGMDGERFVHVMTPGGLDGSFAKTAPGVDMRKSTVELQYKVGESYRIWTWAKTSGTVRFDVAASGVVTMMLEGVPMEPRKGGATGTFTLDATFTIDCTAVEPGSARCEERSGPAHP